MVASLSTWTSIIYLYLPISCSLIFFLFCFQECGISKSRAGFHISPHIDGSEINEPPALKMPAANSASCAVEAEMIDCDFNTGSPSNGDGKENEPPALKMPAANSASCAVEAEMIDCDFNTGSPSNGDGKENEPPAFKMPAADSASCAVEAEMIDCEFNTGSPSNGDGKENEPPAMILWHCSEPLDLKIKKKSGSILRVITP